MTSEISKRRKALLGDLAHENRVRSLQSRFYEVGEPRRGVHFRAR